MNYWKWLMKKQETDKPITTKEIKSAIKTSQQSKAYDQMASLVSSVKYSKKN